MKNNKKMIKGITLIALVVTIIVLLILAGIAVQMLTGNNSILNKAREAKDMTSENEPLERIKLAYGGAITKGLGNVNYTNLNEELTKEFGTGNYTITPENDNTTNWTIIVNNKKYKLLKTGTIKELDSSGIELEYEIDNVNYLYAYLVDQEENEIDAKYYIKKDGHIIYEKNDCIENLYISKAGQYTIIAETDDNVYEETFSITADSTSGYLIEAYNAATELSDYYDKFLLMESATQESNFNWYEGTRKVIMIVEGVAETINVEDCIKDDGECLDIFEGSGLADYTLKKATIIYSDDTKIVEWSGKIFTAHSYIVKAYNDLHNDRFYLARTDIASTIFEILQEYNPKMKIKETGVEINLWQYVTNEGTTIDIHKSELEQYDGKEAIITLQINGKEVKWEGIITPSADIE